MCAIIESFKCGNSLNLKYLLLLENITLEIFIYFFLNNLLKTIIFFQLKLSNYQSQINNLYAWKNLSKIFIPSKILIKKWIFTPNMQNHFWLLINYFLSLQDIYLKIFFALFITYLIDSININNSNLILQYYLDIFHKI